MTEPERMTEADLRVYEFNPRIVGHKRIRMLVAECRRLRTALGAYADLACWRPDHEQPGSPLVIWDGRGNGPNLAREAVGLPKVGGEST